ncbi:MAG: hypothetical protein BAA02_09160 [Paenibacillaceae bacterium ZCTH02-B3]|jgi:uncharacterized CHY-type Zn-finger protein|nr:MAG: hypothetical protein BAA02_09160 [Paenibacillaceae bacterium ZCTH02-B3]
MKTVHGLTVDNQTRCIHYATEKDIVAIRFKCCDKYYPCYQCHEACEDHAITVWKKEEFHEQAILCGICGTEHTIAEYLGSRSCRNCKATFNEGCKKHDPLYFEI